MRRREAGAGSGGPTTTPRWSAGRRLLKYRSGSPPDRLLRARLGTGRANPVLLARGFGQGRGFASLRFASWGSRQPSGASRRSIYPHPYPPPLAGKGRGGGRKQGNTGAPGAPNQMPGRRSVGCLTSNKGKHFGRRVQHGSSSAGRWQTQDRRSRKGGESSKPRHLKQTARPRSTGSSAFADDDVERGRAAAHEPFSSGAICLSSSGTVSAPR
jgi:hypothetical protein